VADAIALFASARRNGHTGALTDRIAALLGIEVVDLAKLRMAPYDYEHGHRDDDFEPLMLRALEFDPLIFASPVYWYSVSSPMKVFLDRVTDFLDLPDLLDHGRRLRGKTGHVVCTSIYPDPPRPFVEAFADTFEYLGMKFGAIAHLNCADGFDDAAADAEARRFLGQFRAPSGAAGA
jgi:multimeric flavodoxin WrbA